MRKVIFLSLVLICFLLPSYASGQNIEDPSVEMKEAYELFLNGNPPEALRRFRDIADRYRGTESGRKALEFLAKNDDLEMSPEYAQRIIEDFPNTIYETRGQIALLGFSFMENPNKEVFLEECDALASALGGPTLREILDSDGSPDIAREIRSLGSDKQKRLVLIYSRMWTMVISSLPAIIPGDTPDNQTALKIVKFLRHTFEPLAIGYNSRTDMIYALGFDVRNSIGNMVFVDPEILFRFPSANAQTGPLPTIQAQITVGDLSRYQVDLSALKASLNGIDVKSGLDFHIDYGNIQPGQVFEKINLKFTPETPLSLGHHTFTLDVPVQEYLGEGPGRTVASLEFTVVSAQQSYNLRATSDSILLERNQHQNEGANSVLTLEKIRGKATRTILGFDVGNLNLNRLSKATLVLTVSPTEQTTGWGNGELILAQTLNSAWVEGNGKSFGLSNSNQFAGTGLGTTWFSPVDENISNDTSNSVVQWSGGASAASPSTAPPVTITNHFSGQVEFDVTTDVLNGGSSWLISKERENKGSKINFYSKEGAALAGDLELAPKLILDFGNQTASTDSESLLSYLGMRRVRVVPYKGNSELPSFREVLVNNPMLAFAGGTVLSLATSGSPALNITSKTMLQLFG